MTYRPSKFPEHRFFHAPWQRSFLANSSQGAAAAKAKGYQWVDNDFHFSKGGKSWVNSHGAPERTWLPTRGDRFEHHEWADLAKLRRTVKGVTYRLRTAGQAIRDNAAAGVSMEFEVKGVAPYAKESLLEAGFARVAKVAEKEYGPHWQQHLVVKVMDSFGDAYVFMVCRAAHKAGIPTLVSVHGKNRRRTYAGHTEITWLRGSLVAKRSTGKPVPPKPVAKPAAATSSADKVIALAKTQVGYHEGRDGAVWNNHQKYSPAVPGLEWSQNQAWCATFISWLALKSGFANLFPSTASTDTAARWWKARGRWSEYPAVGAVGYLGRNGDMFHTFLVTRFDDTYVWTIEGNTNDNGSSQGDGVYALKRRRTDVRIQGYGYPAYPEGIVSADPAWKHAAPKGSAA